MSSLMSLKDQLHKYNIRADKRFGQHFLLDGNITDKITRLTGNLSGVNVIEIGPGPGGLTRSLIKSQANSVNAIEKDSRLLPLLNELKEHSPIPLSIIEADALEISLLDNIPAPRAIIANLPYNVGTAMLIGWLKDIAKDSSSYQVMTLMFQKEVGKRITAQPGSKHYGRLSILSQWLCETSELFNLPANAFTPPPKVESTVIRLVPRQKRQKCEIQSLEKVTGAAFGQRRKMLRASLKKISSNPEALLENCSIDPTLRAENLSIENFIDISNQIT